MESQVTSWAVVQDHVQIFRCLERVMEFQNERMVRKFQNIALGDGISKVIVLDQESFL